MAPAFVPQQAQVPIGKHDLLCTVTVQIGKPYAVGSSGGPVLDNKNRIVGMVSNTQSIYYGSDIGKEPKGPLQMVIKNCVPVSAIKAMTTPKKQKPTATPADR